MIILIAVLIIVVGLLAYTLDINIFAALGILLAMCIVCILIGALLSKWISKNPAKTQSRAKFFKIQTLPLSIMGLTLTVVGYSQVSESSRVVATSQRHLLFETVVTPSSMTCIGMFLILLGLTYYAVASSHLPDNDKK